MVKVKDHKLKDGNGKRINQEELWESFTTELSSDPSDGAYGVFGIEYRTKDDRPTDGIVFVKYMDENKVKVMKKMLYGSTAMAFKGELNAAFVYSLDANSKSDLDLDKVLDKLKKK